VSARSRAALFLYGNGNLAGSALALAGVGLFFAGVIDSWWLAITAGLYVIGYLAAPDGTRDDLQLASQMDASDVSASLQSLSRKINGKVEPEVSDLVSSIQASITTALPRLASTGMPDQTLFTVRQTAIDYLPNTLERYLALPPAFRKLHGVREGKTPRDILLEQLKLLDGKMKEIATSTLESDTQGLLANGRFLEEKFKSGDDLFGR